MNDTVGFVLFVARRGTVRNMQVKPQSSAKNATYQYHIARLHCYVVSFTIVSVHCFKMSRSTVLDGLDGALALHGSNPPTYLLVATARRHLGQR